MKTGLSKLFVYKGYTVKDALKILDNNGKGIVLVLDKDKKLIGTITDGDIRRALLKGSSLDDEITQIVHSNPIMARCDMTKDEIKDIFIKKAIRQLPIVNDKLEVVDLISINEILMPDGKDNYIVIMAGGLGTRLKELTQELPKPMLKIGQDPILQHTINNFKQYGYNKIIMSVNYKAETIENYFQDGYAYGVRIEYIRENQRLGTGGGIRLAKEYLNEPFFVINGDIFTNLNAENMMEHHISKGFDITIGIRKYTNQIPYGIIDMDNECKVKAIIEKPISSYMINAGIYCLNPDIINYLPKDEYFEITDLINICIADGRKVGCYEISEYWMDIGKIEDYVKANNDKKLIILNNKEGITYDKQ